MRIFNDTFKAYPLFETINKPLYFYHLAPKNISNSKGLYSLQYLYDNKMYKLFDKYTDKYRYRICKSWNYSDKNPDELTRREILEYLKKFRNEDELDEIYFFRFPPYYGLGNHMKDILKDKEIYRIDINDQIVKSYIKEIYWGTECSDRNSRKLDRQYYENINQADYFSNYDDNSEMNFASLNHISIKFKKGYCPFELLEIIKTTNDIVTESSILSEGDIQLLLEATCKSGSSVLVQELYPTVSANLSNPNNVNDLSFAIAKYIDRNSQILYDIGIAKKIVFLESDKNAIYDACGLTKEAIRQAIKKSPYIKTSWKILNEPLNTAAVLAIRYFTIQNNAGMVQNLLIYYSMYFYASLHHKYLKFDANENIMEYTINNLSNKFKIKQLGSLFETIKHIVMTSHETYKQDLIRGEDGDLAKYVSSIKVRLNDFMKNVTNEYMKNHKEKRFMNFDSDDYSEDNFHIADNTSYAIKRLTETSLMRLMTYGADMQMAKLAANLSQVSQNEIRNVIINLTDDDSDKIMRLTELILQLYLVDGANRVEEVRGKKFLITCMEIYKKSNTNDKNILEIKQILDEWLKKYSPKYRQTNREATLSNFRRSIFIYFVLHIQQSSR